MFTLRRFLSCALWCALVPLAGCAYLLNIEPQETQGGFNVLVGLPGQPTAARVFTDIGAFAQRRGFVRQSAPSTPKTDPATPQPPAPAPERYLRGKIMLDVTYQADHLRVNATLHSFSHQLDRKFIDRFYGDFAQENAGHYGDADTIFESEGAGGAVGPAKGGGRRGGH